MYVWEKVKPGKNWPEAFRESPFCFGLSGWREIFGAFSQDTVHLEETPRRVVGLSFFWRPRRVGKQGRLLWCLLPTPARQFFPGSECERVRIKNERKNRKCLRWRHHCTGFSSSFLERQVLNVVLLKQLRKGSRILRKSFLRFSSLRPPFLCSSRELLLFFSFFFLLFFFSFILLLFLKVTKSPLLFLFTWVKVSCLLPPWIHLGPTWDSLGFPWDSPGNGAPFRSPGFTWIHLKFTWLAQLYPPEIGLIFFLKEKRKRKRKEQSRKERGGRILFELVISDGYFLFLDPLFLIIHEIISSFSPFFSSIPKNLLEKTQADPGKLHLLPSLR